MRSPGWSSIRLRRRPSSCGSGLAWARATTSEQLSLASLGMFLQPHHLTLVSADDAPILRAGDRAESLLDVLLRVMDATGNEFLVELKAVKRTAQQIAQMLTHSLDNSQFLRMFDLSKALVYHIYAMEGNRSVLRGSAPRGSGWGSTTRTSSFWRTSSSTITSAFGRGRSSRPCWPG